jgi:hypothetical protein
MTASIAASPKRQFFDNAGRPAAGYKLHTYLSGTTTPATTWQDQAATIANTNPITLDSRGECLLWLDDNQEYTLVLKTATGATIWTVNDVSAAAASAALSSPGGAALVGYLSAGDGAVATTMQDKLREFVSVKDFGVVGDGSDETTKLQAALNVLGAGVRLSLDGLTITVNDALSVSNKSGFVIDGEGGSIVAADGMTVASGKGLLYLTGCFNFCVRHLTFNANRANRVPAETYAHTVSVRSCTRFSFEDVRSINAVCDGFYFDATTNTDSATYCRDFQLVRCSADNCYRQGMSVINAWDFLISGGSYTNTNGTAPQAGIDIESNAGPTSLSNARGTIRNVRIEGNTGRGVLISQVGGAESFQVTDCFFNGNGLGGIQTFANDTHISGCVFTGHATVADGIVHFANQNTIVAGSISKCHFYGNTNTTSCVATGSQTRGIKIFGNTVSSQVNGRGFLINGTGQIISSNSINACGNIGITVTAVDCVISENYIRAATGRGIYQVSGGAYRNKIIDNVVQDIESVSGGYIQNDDSNTLIRGNTCVSSSAATSTIGIQLGNSCVDCVVIENTFSNLHSTQPIGFAGNAVHQHTIHSNIGGTANVARKSLSGLGDPSYTTGTRPAANTVVAGQCIFNTTTLRPNWSNGTNWYHSDGTTA